MREGELLEALRMTALPESSDDYPVLVEFLRLYRDSVQFVVNKLWNLETLSNTVDNNNRCVK